MLSSHGARSKQIVASPFSYNMMVSQPAHRPLFLYVRVWLSLSNSALSLFTFLLHHFLYRCSTTSLLYSLLFFSHHVKDMNSGQLFVDASFSNNINKSGETLSYECRGVSLLYPRSGLVQFRGRVYSGGSWRRMSSRFASPAQFEGVHGVQILASSPLSSLWKTRIVHHTCRHISFLYYRENCLPYHNVRFLSTTAIK